MTPADLDAQLRRLIAKALVPPDLCATDPHDIEAMLDAAKGEPLPESQVERILKKAKGELPVGEREEEQPVWSGEALTEEEEALVALHRKEGGELPAEIKEKLRRLRDLARAEPEAGREGEGSDD